MGATKRCAWLLSSLLVIVSPARALGHSNGAGTAGCNGCHSGGKTATVLITPDLTSFAPGQSLNLTISVSATNGTSAGFYLEASSGQFRVVDSGTKLAGSGVTHSATRVGNGMATTFKVGWTAPTTPGGVEFSVWGNSVNGDRSSRGDGEGTGFYSVAFGCDGQKYWHDYDGDGVGAESSGYTVACTVPQFYSTQLGDCDDNDPHNFLGNVEVCDAQDNDCDGEADEALAISTYCTDADADGHGVSGKETARGCGVSKGFGVCDDDCNDENPLVYPGAAERCNNRDDNCDQRIDENARVVCGVGWCSRYAEGCTSQCTPGPPRVEECNDFDDDCDGVKDNGTALELCGKAGLACTQGYCVAAGSGGMSSVAAASGGGPLVSSGGRQASNNAGSSAQPAADGGGTAGESAPRPESSSGCGIGRTGCRATWAVALSALALSSRRKRRPHT